MSYFRNFAENHNCQSLEKCGRQIEFRVMQTGLNVVSVLVWLASSRWTFCWIKAFCKNCDISFVDTNAVGQACFSLQLVTITFPPDPTLANRQLYLRWLIPNSTDNVRVYNTR